MPRVNFIGIERSCLCYPDACKCQPVLGWRVLPERVKRLEADRVDGKAENFMITLLMAKKFSDVGIWA